MTVTQRKLDAEAILRRLTEIRKSIPLLDDNALPPSHDGRPRESDSMQARTAEEFEYAAVADGIESLADELAAALERAHAEAMETALEIYYATEELARDPNNAHLIPHVERMREAYESDYGRPIPPKANS